MKLPEEEERERLKLYNQGLPDGEIGDRLGYSRTCILNWRRSRGLPANRERGERRTLPEEENERRLQDYNNGYTDKQLADMWDMSVSGVRYWRYENDLEPNPPDMDEVQKKRTEKRLETLSDKKKEKDMERLAELFGLDDF